MKIFNSQALFCTLVLLTSPFTQAMNCKDITGAKGIIEHYLQGKATRFTGAGIPFQSRLPLQGQVITKKELSGVLENIMPIEDLGLSDGQIQKLLSMMNDGTILYKTVAGLSLWTREAFYEWDGLSQFVTNPRLNQILVRELSDPTSVTEFPGLSPFWLAQVKRAGELTRAAWTEPLTLDLSSALSSYELSRSYKEVITSYIEHKNYVAVNEDDFLIADFPWSFDNGKLFMLPEEASELTRFLISVSLVSNSLVYDGQEFRRARDVPINEQTQMLLALRPELFPLAQAISERTQNNPQMAPYGRPQIASPLGVDNLLKGKITFNGQETSFYIGLEGHRERDVTVHYFGSVWRSTRFLPLLQQAIVDVLKTTHPQQDIIPQEFYTYEADLQEGNLLFTFRNLSILEGVMIGIRTSELFDPEYTIEVSAQNDNG